MKAYIIKGNDRIERVVNSAAFAEGFCEGAATVDKEWREKHGGPRINWHIEEHEVEEAE